MREQRLAVCLRRGTILVGVLLGGCVPALIGRAEFPTHPVAGLKHAVVVASFATNEELFAAAEPGADPAAPTLSAQGGPAKALGAVNLALDPAHPMTSARRISFENALAASNLLAEKVGPFRLHLRLRSERRRTYVATDLYQVVTGAVMIGLAVGITASRPANVVPDSAGSIVVDLLSVFGSLFFGFGIIPSHHEGTVALSAWLERGQTGESLWSYASRQEDRPSEGWLSMAGTGAVVEAMSDVVRELGRFNPPPDAPPLDPAH